MGDVLKQPFKIEAMTITPENIGKFIIMPNRRVLMDTHVGRINGALLRGDNPMGVLVVNKRDNGVMILIDGNHRLEALKRFFNISTKRTGVDAMLKVYDHLSDNEMLEIYTKEAMVRTESYEDRLQLYKDHLTFWKLLQEDFPVGVSIYRSDKTLMFRTLLNLIYTAKLKREGEYSGAQLKKDNLVPFAMNVLYQDYTDLKEFVKFFISVFGDLTDNNNFKSKNMFIALADIYYRNKQYVKDATFKDRFARIMGKPDIVLLTGLGNKEASLKARKAMIDYMNYNHKTRLFV